MRIVITRRRFITAAGLTTVGLFVGACGGPPPAAVGPSHPLISERERQRRRNGATPTEMRLVAASGPVEVAGGSLTSWAYNGSVPGPEIRLRAGEVLAATLVNQLPQPTSIHWHGIALRNDMDGVPGLTQPPIEPGEEFRYEFVAPHPGTYFFHPHVGVQLDRGLYAPLVVEDPREPGDYDLEAVIVLDDWTDGIGEDPDTILSSLSEAGMPGMDHGEMGVDSGMSPDMTEESYGGDVTYPLYLVNGRSSEAPHVVEARPGQRVRLRVINAGSDTAFRLALGGHRLTVTHSDGFPVEPVEVDALIVGMGERYDLVTTLADGVFPLAAVAEGKGVQTFAVVKTGSGELPPGNVPVAELSRRLLTPDDLRARADVAFPTGEPDVIVPLELGGDMMAYRWTINGRTFNEADPIEVTEGRRIRLAFSNRSTMFHPMHLHGHTFQVVRNDGAPGARKDTLIVLPGQDIAVDVDTDNPGAWALHCHNIYHAEAGMMTVMQYVL